MGRAENRKRNKKLRQRLSDDQVDRLINQSNQEFIQAELKAKGEAFKHVIVECLIEALVKNDISRSKIIKIERDIDLILTRRLLDIEEAKKNVPEC